MKRVPRRRPDARSVEPEIKRHGLARWLSKLGLMSRTEGERCVRDGRVALNGKIVTDPERPAHPELDQILLDGHPLKPARKIYLAVNKPEGYITTAHDPQGRPTAYELLPPNASRVQAVGRLDADTSGLLVFTNDTEFAARITDGKGDVEKVYVARIKGRLNPRDRLRFERGVDLDGEMTRPAKCNLLEPGEESTESTLVEVTIVEGRNRQIRRMWESLGYPVLHLKRVRVGPIALGNLPVGRSRPISEYERATLIVDTEELKSGRKRRDTH